jgi:outer membrane protein assembly factor BamB
MQQGQMIWQQRISTATGPTEIDRLNDVDTTPVIVNGVVYALAYNGNLTALDLRSGQIMWKRELGSVNDFIVDGNRIYLVDQNDRLLALTTDGGVTLWTQSDLLHRLLTAPVLYNGNLVVGDSEGYMHWVNPEDGHFVAQQKVDSSGFLTDPVCRWSTADPGERRHAVRDYALITAVVSFEKRPWQTGAVLTF